MKREVVFLFFFKRMRKVQDLVVATVSYLRNGRGSGFGSGSSQLGLANSLNSPQWPNAAGDVKEYENLYRRGAGVQKYKYTTHLDQS